MLAIELAERVPPGFQLGQRRLRLPARRPGAHLLLLQRTDVAPRLLQGLHRVYRGTRIPTDTLGGRLACPFRFARRRVAIGALGRRQRELFAQLTALAIERGTFQLEGPRSFGATPQCVLQLAQGGALRGEPAAHVVFVVGARPQLTLHGSEIALRRAAVRFGCIMLAFRLCRPPLGLRTLFCCRMPPLLGVPEPFGGEREIAIESSDFELGVTETPLHFRAARLSRVTRLHPRLTLMLCIAESRAGRRYRIGQLAGADTEGAE